MARGRDLTFSLLSDTKDLILDKAADEFEDLARTASEAALGLDEVGDATRRVEDDVRRVDLEGTIGKDAKDAARKVEDAFDAIARASKTSTKKVDDSADTMKGKFRDIRDEAADTAREAGASFSSTGDIGDAMQELAANAGVTFGPIGIALGVAAAAGVGLFRAQSEKMKEEVDELVDEMIEGAGRVSDEFVNTKLVDLAKSGDLERLREAVDLYDIAGISYRDMARARAGDEKAIGRVTAALDRETDRRKSSEAEMTRSEAAVTALSAQIDGSREAYKLAMDAMGNYEDAASTAAEGTKRAGAGIRSDWGALRTELGRGINAPINVDAPSPAQLAAIRRGIVRGIGPVVVNARVIPPSRSALFYPGRTRP